MSTRRVAKVRFFVKPVFFGGGVIGYTVRDRETKLRANGTAPRYADEEAAQKVADVLNGAI